MVRPTAQMAALLAAVMATDATAQDTDELKLLKQENLSLRIQLEAANRKIKELQDQLKGGESKPMTTRRTLADLLTVGTTVRGDYRFREGNKARGDWTLTIKEIKGKMFKGIYTAKETHPTNGPGSEVEAEGEIDGDRLTFKIVNTTKIQATARGGLTSEGLILVWDGRKGVADMKASLQR